MSSSNSAALHLARVDVGVGVDPYLLLGRRVQYSVVALRCFHRRLAAYRPRQRDLVALRAPGASPSLLGYGALPLVPSYVEIDRDAGGAPCVTRVANPGGRGIVGNLNLLEQPARVTKSAPIESESLAPSTATLFIVLLRLSPNSAH